MKTTEQVTGTVNGRFTFTPRDERIEAANIEVRRWFEKTNGNTYFSAVISVNGSPIHRIPFEYGYGDHGVFVACEWLVNGIRNAGGFTQYIPEHDTDSVVRIVRDRTPYFTTQVVDVPRRKDL